MEAVCKRANKKQKSLGKQDFIQRKTQKIFLVKSLQTIIRGPWENDRGKSCEIKNKKWYNF
jgi:hypothetical protein